MHLTKICNCRNSRRGMVIIITISIGVYRDIVRVLQIIAKLWGGDWSIKLIAVYYIYRMALALPWDG